MNEITVGLVQIDDRLDMHLSLEGVLRLKEPSGYQIKTYKIRVMDAEPFVITSTVTDGTEWGVWTTRFHCQTAEIYSNDIEQEGITIASGGFVVASVDREWLDENE